MNNIHAGIASFYDLSLWEMQSCYDTVKQMVNQGLKPCDYYIGISPDILKDNPIIKKDLPNSLDILKKYKFNSYGIATVNFIDGSENIDPSYIPLGHVCPVLDIQGEIEAIKDTMKYSDIKFPDQDIKPNYEYFGVTAICRDFRGNRWEVFSSGSISRRY
jgi:hypothetical protein